MNSFSSHWAHSASVEFKAKINFVFQQFAFASLKKIVRECRISWSIGVKRVIIAYIAYGSLSGQFILNIDHYCVLCFFVNITKVLSFHLSVFCHIHWF